MVFGKHRRSQNGHLNVLCIEFITKPGKVLCFIVVEGCVRHSRLGRKKLDGMEARGKRLLAAGAGEAEKAWERACWWLMALFKATNQRVG
ncbi:hypothetical protein NDU88_006126 [Pleurodeles waltl]|uniref:Uncharacterized protein n=1 Tax=Pleurodeles waltl TaxID=8319 RepID=A0AAV7NPC9_PLEWA|nr:hypothetical protein NDU88_006126 [Pleurodeles waltl]